MKNNSRVRVTDDSLQVACKYLQKQFEIKSWWPREQPRLAEREFLLMKGSAGALNLWCERWLDAGQCRKLENIIKQSV